MVARVSFNAPSLGAQFGAGFDAGQRNRLADAQNRRAENMLTMQRQQFDWQRETDERDFGFKKEGRDREWRMQEEAAAARARRAAAAERAGLQRAQIEQIGRVLDFAGTLPEGERFETLSRFIDPKELRPFLVGPEANPVLSDRVLNEMRLGYGMAPSIPAPMDYDLRELPDGTLAHVPTRPGAGGAIPVAGGEAPPPVADEGYRLLTREEVAATPGLDPARAYQIGPDNKITTVGSGGVTVNVGDEQPEIEAGKPPQDYAFVPDETAPSGRRAVLITGTPTYNATVGAVQQADQALSTLSAIRELDPKRFVGRLESALPDVSADAREFSGLMAQVRGQAFLQAIERLRGTGVISDVEGEKGTQAIMRMRESTEPEAFNRALNDFERVILTGRQNAERNVEAAGGRVPTNSVVIQGEEAPEGSVIELNDGTRVTVRNGMLEDEQGRRYDPVTGARVR